MKQNNFICFNGELHNSNTPVFTLSNRAFHYGDGIFETMRAIGTTVPFLELHYKRLVKSSEILKMNLPENFSLKFLSEKISRLLNANKLFRGTRIRLTMFRKDGGLFLPDSNEVNYSIETTELESDKFTLNKKGLSLGVYPDYRKNIHPFNRLKLINSQLSILGAMFSAENNLDECLFLNEHNRIVEAVSYNIFIRTGNNLATPSHSEGCLAGIMRHIILDVASKQGMNVSDSAQITENDLLNADELFLTNAVSGIRWVLSFGNRRYFNTAAKILTEKLCKKALI